jgi:hypothetical protein
MHLSATILMCAGRVKRFLGRVDGVAFAKGALLLSSSTQGTFGRVKMDTGDLGAST